MKIGLIVLVVFVLAMLGYRYLDWDSLDRAPSKVASAPGVDPSAPKRDFKELSASLATDMGRIPANLKDPRQVPAHAFDIKAKLQGLTQMHEEYQVLDQVCDLIIYADQEHSVRQRQCGLAQGDLYTSPLTEAKSDARDRASALTRGAIYEQNQALWATYRRQTDNEVKRLLALLDNKRL